ncbi:hypothetical protein CTT34_15735 [Vreelandella aquamarina]|uniref:Uncharacterized protein n=1 Tax=Vreelandella aquamarina TaxID=77097 RepID=A0A857GR39_9GAMM|nr:hypothetical protein CTT34_15735 [Halomonas meridiana]
MLRHPQSDAIRSTVKSHAANISALYVVNELIPKIKAVEKQIEHTISTVLKTSQTPLHIERYTKLQAEFQLELTMIRMNLDHLLQRYHKELEVVMQDSRQDVLLSLDAFEATAIQNAQQLYQRVQQLQQRQ